MKVSRTARSARAAVLCVALGIATSGAPWAAEPPPPVTVDPLVRFKELSAKAEAAYQVREYQVAIDTYVEAYAVLPSADLLYNVAYIYDHHMQQRAMAQDFYRRVIRTPESSPEIMALAVKRLAELDAEEKASVTVLKTEDKPPTSEQVAPPPEQSPDGVRQELVRDSGPGAPPWVVVAIGGAAVVTGVVFGIAAQGTNDDYRREPDLARKRLLEDRGRAQALTSDILGITGGLLVASGLIWYVAASGDDPPPPRMTELPPVRPLITRDGIGIAFGGTL